MFELMSAVITEQQKSLSSQASSVHVWAGKSLTQASVQAPSQCGLTSLPVSMYTDRISNSVNYYVSLLSALCACVQMKKMALQMKP